MKLKLSRLPTSSAAPADTKDKAPPLRGDGAAPKAAVATFGLLMGLAVFAPDVVGWEHMLQAAYDRFGLPGSWRLLVPLLLFGAAAQVTGYLAALGARGYRQAREKASTSIGARAFYVAAFSALMVSADTSWRLFEWLGVTAVWERTALFAVVEIAMIACGVAMRAGVRANGDPGPARWLAWALCGVAAYGAIAFSGPIEGVLRVLLGPVLGLVSLHLAMGIEIRSKQHTRNATWERVLRELRERVLSRLGLADDERDALTRTRHRAARRAARLALAKRVPFRRWRHQRALRVADVAHDPAAMQRMLEELAVLRYADQLATLEQPSPWRKWVADEPAATEPETVAGSPDETTEEPDETPDIRSELAQTYKVSQAKAIRAAFRMVGASGAPEREHDQAVIELFAKHGVVVDPAYVRTTRYRMAAEAEKASKQKDRASLTVVGGAS